MNKLIFCNLLSALYTALLGHIRHTKIYNCDIYAPLQISETTHVNFFPFFRVLEQTYFYAKVPDNVLDKKHSYFLDKKFSGK